MFCLLTVILLAAFLGLLMACCFWLGYKFGRMAERFEGWQR